MLTNFVGWYFFPIITCDECWCWLVKVSAGQQECRGRHRNSSMIQTNLLIIEQLRTREKLCIFTVSSNRLQESNLPASHAQAAPAPCIWLCVTVRVSRGGSPGRVRVRVCVWTPPSPTHTMFHSLQVFQVRSYTMMILTKNGGEICPVQLTKFSCTVSINSGKMRLNGRSLKHWHIFYNVAMYFVIYCGSRKSERENK